MKISRNHYVYRTTSRESGKFYIGKRSCHVPIERDPYLGSGVWVKCATAAGVHLMKEVLVVCATEELAYSVERFLVERARRSDPLCMNLAEGGLGLTSAVAREIMNRPDRKEIARQTAIRVGPERVKVMQAKTTRAQRSASGRAGGLAGRGASRNAGAANGNYGRPASECSQYDPTTYRLRHVSGAAWCGTKSEMSLLGASNHWYSLCNGKRKSVLGYALDV